VCYPLGGGTGARSTVTMPSGSVTVQLTALAARPVFWPYALITTPPGLKVIDSRTMCWPSIHRLAESPGEPTTVIVPTGRGAFDGERLQTLSGRGVGDGRRRGQRDRGGC
jgi:hypothetical protein